jgi:NAD(P)-dependent dehydrogenase (short-subunit alcohol dehydrogenase family)
MNLKGKCAVVLGASAKGGSGWCTAELLASRGAKVVVGARRYSGVAELAQQIGGTAVQCDAAIEDEVRAMAELAERQYGKIDIAILAAGTPFVGTIDTISQEQLTQATAINYYGVLYFIRHMTRHMADGGGIAIVSSLSTDRTIPGYGAYSCARGAANTLVKYAALEYAPRGIRVNAVVAGLIASPMTAMHQANKEAWDVFLREIPLKRAVQPAEIGAACVWLCSPEAAMTGECMRVDNGQHLLRSPQPYEMPPSLYAEAASSAGY